MHHKVGPNNRIYNYPLREPENSRGNMEFLTDLLRDLETKQNYSAFSHAIGACAQKHPEMHYAGPNWYKIGEHYLKLGTRREEEIYRSRLPMLKKEGIGAAPLYCDSAVSKEGFAALLLQVPGTKSGDLRYFCDAHRSVPKEVKERAFEDVETLVKDMGFINPRLLDQHSLSITPDSENQKILAMNWDEFYPVCLNCTEAEYDKMVKKLLRQAERVLFQR